MDEAMQTIAPPLQAAPDATMLGRLLVIQQAMDAMPDELHIAGFLGRALASLPGVAEAHIDLEGHTAPPGAFMAALKERCEREASPVPVLNFMRNRGRHSPHGSHLFSPDPGFHFPQILQEHDTQTFVGIVLRGGQSGPNMKLSRVSPCKLQVDLGLLWPPQPKRAAHDICQRLPGQVGA